MAEKGVDVGIATNCVVLWIHGYSGSASAFAPTAERISRELGARVMVPLLPGHGTEQHDLIGLRFEDFLGAAREAGHELLRENKPLIIVGYCFGCYLAAELVRELRPQALVLALTPFKIQFPLSLPYMEKFLLMRPFWNKLLTRYDRYEREGTFYYPDLPGTSLSFTLDGNDRLQKTLGTITCPILTLHNQDDPLAAPQSGALMLEASGHNPANEAHILPHGRHALFFRPQHDEEEEILSSFLRKQFP